MIFFGDTFRNRRVLLTGHTGFKGSWLALWLKTLGAEVTGLSLAPNTNPSHWNLLNLDINEKYIDIRNSNEVIDIVDTISPEIVFHLAAQSLVRHSYHKPLKTWSTNVMGTANLLEACRQKGNIKAIVAVTTDKCYQNQERALGYCEDDRLGGHDPYSASKASAELVISSYRDAFFNKKNSTLLASARAGNVIGGGDWSEDRLIPDLVRSITSCQTLDIRSPSATRPWQHVLDSLSGYLCLGQKLLTGNEKFATAWNFGPDDSGNRSVKAVLTHLKKDWPTLDWRTTHPSQQLHETNLLNLDSTRARQQLEWKPIWSFEESLSATAQWYKANLVNKTVISEKQICDYSAAAKQAGLPWGCK